MVFGQQSKQELPIPKMFMQQLQKAFYFGNGKEKIHILNVQTTKR